MGPGPIIDGDTDRPTFYNGGTKDAKGSIGWATFDARPDHVVVRSDDPLIVPDEDLPADANDMVFAASAVAAGDECCRLSPGRTRTCASPHCADHGRPSSSGFNRALALIRGSRHGDPGNGAFGGQ